MTCNVEILSVIGYVTDDDEEELYEIHVEGRIDDDEAVHIGETVTLTHYCYKREGIQTIVKADGTWEGNLPYIREEDESEESEEPPCDCGLMIRISASLSTIDGPVPCGVGIWEEVLECETKSLCPETIHIHVERGDCINGKRQVTLEATISSANTDEISWYTWDFEDVDVECTAGTTPNGECTVDDHITSKLTIDRLNGISIDVDGNLVQTTGEILIPAPCDAEVEIKVTFMVTSNSIECGNDSKTKIFNINGCGAPSPEITDIEVVQRNCNNDLTKRFIYFIPHVDGAGVTEYIWDYGDGTIDNNGEHWYDLGANQEVTLTIIGPSSCPEIEPFTKTFEVKCERDGPCPDGEVWNPTTQKCEEPPTPPPNGVPRKCCFLIYAWLVTFVSIWFVTQYWPALISAIGTSITLLIAWFLLCKRCGHKFWKKKFWRCNNPFTNCCFLRWTILGHKLALLVLGVAVIGGYYLPPWYVWTMLTVGLAFWEGIWSRAKNKWKFKCEYPIPLDRSTWPPCKCRR